jgi:hypothetical protein
MQRLNSTETKAQSLGKEQVSLAWLQAQSHFIFIENEISVREHQKHKSMSQIFT